MTRRRINIGLDCLAAAAAALLLIWMGLGHRLDRVSQFLWVGIALGWILISLLDDMRPRRDRNMS